MFGHRDASCPRLKPVVSPPTSKLKEKESEVSLASDWKEVKRKGKSISSATHPSSLVNPLGEGSSSPSRVAHSVVPGPSVAGFNQNCPVSPAAYFPGMDSSLAASSNPPVVLGPTDSGLIEVSAAAGIGPEKLVCDGEASNPSVSSCSKEDESSNMDGDDSVGASPFLEPCYPSKLSRISSKKARKEVRKKKKAKGGVSLSFTSLS